MRRSTLATISAALLLLPALGARAETSVQYWMDVQTWGPTERLRKEAHRMVADDVTGFIVDGIARGIFRPVNPRFVAYLAWLGSVSSHQPAFLEETGMTWAEAMEGIADLLVAGLSVDRAAQAEAGGAA
jgi:hypothetical protein